MYCSRLSSLLSLCVFFGAKQSALIARSFSCTTNEKYSDPFEDILVGLTFWRYPIRVGTEDLLDFGEKLEDVQVEVEVKRLPDGGVFGVDSLLVVVSA